MTNLPPQLEPDITIQDPVHGRIPLTDVERSVINTPQFQRLRRIGQLGPADYVFPGACHNRFIHSLGAAHVMGWMLAQRSLQKHFDGRENMIQILRLAALLHDLGHLPFSHIGEVAYGIVDRGGINEYVDGTTLTAFDVAARGAPHGLHEKLTVDLIRNGEVGTRIDDRLDEVDGTKASELVALIIEGSYPSDLVCTNLVSSDLDCDRLDYLVRDSLAAGLTYGQVDLSYLIESLVVAEHPQYGPMLAVDEQRGASAVEHYLLARYYYYARFVGHKTIAAAELLMIVAMLELVRVEKLPSSSEQLAKLLDGPEFLGLDDGYLWHLLHKAAFDGGDDTVLTEAAGGLINRTLLKCAYLQEDLEEPMHPGSHRENTLDQLFRDEAAKKRLAEDANVPAESFCFLRRRRALAGIPGSISPTQVIEDGGQTVAAQWIKSVKVAAPGEPPALLAERGEMLRHLASREWVTRSVLVREHNPEAEDKSKRPTTLALRKYLRERVG